MLEERIQNIIKPSIEAMGYGLVKVGFRGGQRRVLEILIDRVDGSLVSLEDCRKVSKNISAIIDVEDIIADQYSLEVSSAGLERPLVALEDYARFIGRDVKIVLHNLDHGRSKYRGKITSVIDQDIRLKTNDGEDKLFGFNDIKSGNLVFTDEMARDLLKQSNKTK